MSGHTRTQQLNDVDTHRQTLTSATSFMTFECMHCCKLFARRWFDIGAGFERLHYNAHSGYSEIEVDDAEGIGVFCSRACLESGRTQVMATQGVPIPRVRPGLGPIEICAMCNGVVDLREWHCTYTDGQLEEQPDETVEVMELDYVAVVCRRCRPKGNASIATVVDARSECTNLGIANASVLCT